jgi:hypothetical protein
MLLQYDQVAQCGALRRGSLKLVWNGDCGNDPVVFGSWEAPPSPPLNVPRAQSHGKDNGSGDSGGGGGGSGRWELFDLSLDPHERQDVSTSASLHYAQAFDDMKSSLEAYGRATVPALAWETPGDPNASPALHGGYWVPWLEREHRPATTATTRTAGEDT